MFYLNLILSLWVLLLNDPIKRCNNFHRGNFVYAKSEYKGVVIHRFANEQVEQVGDTLKIFFSIKWLDDCNYILVPNKVFYKSVENVLPKDTILVHITEVLSDTSYRYTAIANTVETKYIIIKLK